jgi:hypothetical protein
MRVDRIEARKSPSPSVPTVVEALPRGEASFVEKKMPLGIPSHLNATVVESSDSTGTPPRNVSEVFFSLGGSATQRDSGERFRLSQADLLSGARCSRAHTQSATGRVPAVVARSFLCAAAFGRPAADSCRDVQRDASANSDIVGPEHGFVAVALLPPVSVSPVPAVRPHVMDLLLDDSVPVAATSRERRASLDRQRWTRPPSKRASSRRHGWSR